MNTQHAQRVLDFQKIRTVPLAAVLERYGILGDLKKIGSQHFGLCPIHKGMANRKAFVCDLNKNLWRCFGDCDRGGSTIELVSALENIDARAAAELISKMFAIGSRQTDVHRKKRSVAMSENHKPTHKVFLVEGEGDDAFWHRAGSAWTHGDGKGLNLQIPPGMSLAGRVVVREYNDKDADEKERKGAARKK